MMEYLPYFISAGIGMIVWFLQTGNNRKYNEFKKLEEKVNAQDKQIAVNSSSDKSDSKRFEDHQRSMNSKFDELNKILGSFTSEVKQEIKEIKDSVKKLEISVATLTK